MTLMIPDEILTRAGITEHEARVTLACGLFDSGRLPLWPAAQLAGLSRADFEAELARRDIPIYRPTLEDYEADLRAAKKMGL